jgi:hypothetical protein
MTNITSSQKNRTSTSPLVNKGYLQTRQSPAESSDIALLVDNIVNGMIFGPYLVPVSRRAE